MKEKFAVLEIDVELTAFEVWLLEHINQNYPALKLKTIHPPTTPWELARSGIDPWEFVKKFSVEFAADPPLTERELPAVVYFDITPLEKRGIQVTVATSAPVDKTYLGTLVNSIKLHWQEELIATFAASFTASMKDKGLLLLQRLYEQVGSDTRAVENVFELSPQAFAPEEALQAMYYLIGNGWSKPGRLRDGTLGIRITARGIKKLESEFEQYTRATAVHVQNILVERFDLEEFKNLCFRLARLGITFDSLRGEGLPGKARELVAYFQRRQQLHELIHEIRQERPDIDL